MIPWRYPDWRASRRVIGSTLRSHPVENKASILEVAPPSGDHRRGRRREA